MSHDVDQPMPVPGTPPTNDEIEQAITARAGWEDKQLTWYQMRHDGLRRLNKPWPNAADMHYPLADGMIEKLKPTFIAQVFATDTVATFTALKADYSAYQAGCAQWLDYQLKQASNFEEELDIAIDRHLERAICPVKVCYDVARGRLEFEACDPRDIIVPVATGQLREADWIVHVQRYTCRAYLALPGGFDQSAETVGRLMGGGNDDAGNRGETARTVREGINRGAKQQAVLWEIFFRDKAGKWRVQTRSPATGERALRPEFGLPYNRGVFAAEQPPPPFMRFQFETKERGHYAPRGVCERVANEEKSLSKDWNTMKDWQTITCSPVFSAKGGIGSMQNVRMIPGQILPFELTAVTFPEMPFEIGASMQNTLRVAEDRLSVPSVGVGRTVDPSNKETAAKTNLMAGLMQGNGDVRARDFRRQLGELLNLAWGILLQYRGEAIDYYFNNELLALDRAALEGDYRVEPSGSGDNNNRALVLQRATGRKQMFTGSPHINQRELDRSVLEADDPRMVKRLLINEGTAQAEQLEDQAQELSIMLLGFPAEVRPADDDASHVQSVVGFVQRRATTGEPMSAEFLQLVTQHVQTHLQALRKKNAPVFAGLAPKVQPWLAEVQRQAQALAQQEQLQAQAAPAGPDNVVPMGREAMP